MLLTVYRCAGFRAGVGVVLPQKESPMTKQIEYDYQEALSEGSEWLAIRGFNLQS